VLKPRRTTSASASVCWPTSDRVVVPVVSTLNPPTHNYYGIRHRDPEYRDRNRSSGARIRPATLGQGRGDHGANSRLVQTVRGSINGLPRPSQDRPFQRSRSENHLHLPCRTLRSRSRCWSSTSTATR
jgi:hypothetical protein